MKLVLKSICAALVICYTVCAASAVPKTKPVDEFKVMRAVVVQTTPIENEFKFEIETTDGNLWIIYGDENLSPETNLIVVFYTFESSEVECWEVLDFWATQK